MCAHAWLYESGCISHATGMLLWILWAEEAFTCDFGNCLAFFSPPWFLTGFISLTSGSDKKGDSWINLSPVLDCVYQHDTSERWSFAAASILQLKELRHAVLSTAIRDSRIRTRIQISRCLIHCANCSNAAYSLSLHPRILLSLLLSHSCWSELSL